MTVTDNEFSIICLQMCEVSYLPLVEIPQYVAQVNPLKPHEPWKCTWAWQNEDNANLAFVALHYPNGGAKPDQAILAIRGTDIDVSDLWGILWQSWEDLDFLIQVPVTWASNDFPNARIAQGTREGADQILDLMWPGQTLKRYLKTLLTDNPDLSLTVTGHSLGACLTTVVASKLRGKYFPNTQIQVVTFAGPSAGNQDFANYFNKQFPQAMCYASGLDIAPYSWGNLAGLDLIYIPFFLTPDTVIGGTVALMTVVALMDLVNPPGVGYVQPNLTKPPNNAQISDAPDWYAEAFYQHHPTTYMKWMGGKDVGATPPVLVKSSKSTDSTLGAKLRELAEQILKYLSGIGPKPTT